MKPESTMWDREFSNESFPSFIFFHLRCRIDPYIARKVVAAAQIEVVDAQWPVAAARLRTPGEKLGRRIVEAAVAERFDYVGRGTRLPCFSEGEHVVIVWKLEGRNLRPSTAMNRSK